MRALLTCVIAIILPVTTGNGLAQTCPVSAPGALAVLPPVCAQSAAVYTTPCALNQPLEFRLITLGYTPQACDIIEWNFGDGATTTTIGSTPATHTYVVPGYYVIRANIRNDLGARYVNEAWLWAATGYAGFTMNHQTVGEPDGAARLVVHRSASTSPMTCEFMTSDSGGLAGTRYTATAGTLHFAPGQTSAEIVVPLLNDSVAGGPARFDVTLSSISDGYLALPQLAPQNDYFAVQEVTVIDDEVLPESIISCDRNAVFVMEGGTVTQTFRRTGDLTRTQSVNGVVHYAYAWGDTQLLIGGDEITFLPGETVKSRTLSVTSDEIFEGDRSAVFWVHATGGATLAISRNPDGFPELVLGVIEDEIRPSMTVDDISVVRGTVGDPVATFTVRFSGRIIADIPFTWSTADGTAIAGRDYVASSGAEVVRARETAATFSVPIVADGDIHNTRTFTVSVIIGGDARLRPTVLKSSAVATILADDASESIPALDPSVLALLALALAAVSATTIRR